MATEEIKTIMLGKEILRGLFFIKEHLKKYTFMLRKFDQLREFSDSTSFYTNQLISLRIYSFLRRQIRKKTNFDLDLALSIAACARLKNMQNAIFHRIQNGPELDGDQIEHVITYCVTMNLKLDKEFFLNFLKIPSFRAAAYTYIEFDPSIISNKDLFKLVNEAGNWHHLSENVNILIRLARVNMDITPSLTKLVNGPHLVSSFTSIITKYAIEKKDRSICAILLDSENIDVRETFLLTCIKINKHEFILDLLEAKLAGLSDSSDFVYLLPAISLIKPMESDWLLPYILEDYDWCKRMGSAYAIAEYPQLYTHLERLALDRDGDVSNAAKTVLLFSSKKSDSPFGLSWSIWCSYMLKNTYSKIFNAHCISQTLPRNDILRDYELMNSVIADLDELCDFYKERRHLLMGWIDKDDLSTINLKNTTGDEPDKTGRAALVMATLADHKARIFFDQYLADTKDEESAQWVAVFLEVCGGPITPLSSLKYRILQCREHRDVFIENPEDIGLLPAVCSEDSFWYDNVISIFRNKIVRKYPHLLSHWLRQRHTSSSDDIFISHLPKTSVDPLVLDMIRILKKDTTYGDLEFPERHTYNFLGQQESITKHLPDKIIGSNLSPDHKNSLFSLLASQRNIGVSQYSFITSLSRAIKNEKEMLAFYKTLLNIPDYDISFLLQLIIKLDLHDAFETLIKEWEKSVDSTDLYFINKRIAECRELPFSRIILYSLSGLDIIFERLKYERDDFEKLHGDIEFDDENNLEIIETMFLDKFKNTNPGHIGKQLIIQPFSSGIPMSHQTYISIHEFDQLALGLKIEFNDETSGTILCQVSSEHTGEVLRLLFEKKPSIGFWAYWV